MSQSNIASVETDSISTLGWVALGLVFLTGIFHLYSGVVESRIPVLLAGIGFFGAIVLYLIDYRRRLLYLVGIVYTAVQIPIWYVVKAGEYTTVGFVDKAVQVVLVVLLAYLWWSTRTGDSYSEATEPGQTG
jgi:hypothetical protein